MPVKETKSCKQCGKSFANRKSWRLRGQWDQVVYCSDRCRRAAGKEKLSQSGSF